MIKNCILVHYHEIGLKGDNKAWFEKILLKNIRKKITPLPFTSININSSRIFLFGINENKWNEYSRRLKQIIGIKNALLVKSIDADIEHIKNTSEKILKDVNPESFRITTKRQYKNYPLTSQEINEQVGEHLVSVYSIKVNLTNPEINIIIELVKGRAYVGYKKILGYGGLPVGTGEKGLSLISSGIDSPVSSFHLIKRGVYLDFSHFHSYPATSKQSINNVEKILSRLSDFQFNCGLFIVPFLEIQETIMEKTPDKYWIILFRRMMFRIAEQFANKIDAKVLVTGENIGQVASQTLSNIRTISESVSIPIIRPLAGLNKEDIINYAIDLETYEISIQPYEDCCSFFVPIHPKISTTIKEINIIEEKIDIDSLCKLAIKNTESKQIGLI